MGFTRGLDPKVAMGLDVTTNKVRDWINNYKFPYNDLESIRRKENEDGEQFYKITLNANSCDWEYGDITITFKFKFKYESYTNNKDMGFTRGLEPNVAMGYDLATEKVRDWIKKYKLNYVSPESIRRKKNGNSEEFYILTLVPNKDAWEYGDIIMIFHISEAQI